MKKTRKSTPKLRRGCKTCKFRRLKCDEQKPSCLHSLRRGAGIRGGYTETTTIVRPAYRPLQPALLKNCHTGPRFQNEEEHRYFQIFRHQVSPNLGGAFAGIILSPRLVKTSPSY